MTEDFTMDDFREHRRAQRALGRGVEPYGVAKQKRDDAPKANFAGDASKLCFVSVCDDTWQQVADAARTRGMSAGHLLECILVDSLDRVGA